MQLWQQNTTQGNGIQALLKQYIVNALTLPQETLTQSKDKQKS